MSSCFNVWSAVALPIWFPEVQLKQMQCLSDLKLTEIEETNWQKPLGILLQNLLY
jgi:hypothetical protein